MKIQALLPVLLLCGGLLHGCSGEPSPPSDAPELKVEAPVAPEPAPSVPEAERVADILIEPTGEVSVELLDAEVWIPLTEATLLAEGDGVRTGPGASATITFPDGSKARLNAESTLVLTSLGTEEDPGVSLLLLAGEVWSSVKRALPGGSFEVRTETTLAVVRGTEFNVALDDEGTTTIEVYESAVDVSTFEAQTEDGEPVATHQTSVGEGQQVKVTEAMMDALRSRLRAPAPGAAAKSARSARSARAEEAGGGEAPVTLQATAMDDDAKQRSWVLDNKSLPEATPVFTPEQRAQMRADLEQRTNQAVEALPETLQEVEDGLIDGIERLDQGLDQGLEKLDVGVEKLDHSVEKLDEGVEKLRSKVNDRANERSERKQRSDPEE